ncbi:MAG: histidine phosphatase family protein [Ktedonobacterales bacterium]
MLTLFYSPHMSSVDNEAKRASGHADVPLSKLGRQQAQELGRYYATKTFDAIFCSDLQRAVTTSQIAFAGRGLPIVADARLREYDYGDMTQFPVAQVEEEFPRRINQPFPNGESLLMVAQRMRDFLQELSSRYGGKTLVIIGHRATRYALEHWCSGVSLEEIVRAPWPWVDIPIWRYELDEL